MRIICALIIINFITIKLFGQQVDSLATAASADTLLVVDSAKVHKGLFSFITKDYPSPKKAAYLSLALPGAGQMYNKRWWKVPLVYGALGGMVLTIDYNQGLYRRFKKAYIQKLNGEETEFEGFAVNTPSGLRRLRDKYDKSTQLSYIGLVFVYGLQAMEAFVDAHLKTFDVSEDLSLQLKPSLQTDSFGQSALGVGVALRFE